MVKQDPRQCRAIDGRHGVRDFLAPSTETTGAGPVHAPSAVHAHVHVNDHGHVDERESRIAWTLTWSCTCSSSSVAHVAVFMKQSASLDFHSTGSANAPDQTAQQH